MDTNNTLPDQKSRRRLMVGRGVIPELLLLLPLWLCGRSMRAGIPLILVSVMRNAIAAAATGIRAATDIIIGGRVLCCIVNIPPRL